MLHFLFLLAFYLFIPAFVPTASAVDASALEIAVPVDIAQTDGAIAVVNTSQDETALGMNAPVASEQAESLPVENTTSTQTDHDSALIKIDPVVSNPEITIPEVSEVDETEVAKPDSKNIKKKNNDNLITALVIGVPAAIIVTACVIASCRNGKSAGGGAHVRVELGPREKIYFAALAVGKILDSKPDNEELLHICSYKFDPNDFAGVVCVQRVVPGSTILHFVDKWAKGLDNENVPGGDGVERPALLLFIENFLKSGADLYATDADGTSALDCISALDAAAFCGDENHKQEWLTYFKHKYPRKN